MESIGGNIISALGAGSGINSNSIVDQLTEIERQPRQQQIDTKRETFEAQISDYGIIRSALSTLQNTADSLSDSATFNSKSASFTDSTAFIPVSLSEDVPVGEYAFEVIDVAQSQSLSTSASYADADSAIGKGTLTINFGAWDVGVPPTTFTQDTSEDALVITIDDNNNSLSGLRDAINQADVGINASVINDGTEVRLLLTAESGLSNQMEITAAEDAGSPGLANFDFNQSTQSLNQAQAGKDSSLKINGLDITRSSNNIDDVLEGFSFTLAKADPGNIVTVTVSEDKAIGEQSIRDFVDSFNTFLEAIQPAVGVDEEDGETGSLDRDPTARSLESQLRNLIASGVPGVDSSGFTALTNVGVRTELDGSLTIDEDDLRLAIDNNYDLVKSLFVPQATSTASDISVNSSRTSATPGSYSVAITQDPTKGQLVGAASAGTLLADLAVARTAGDFTSAVSAFVGTDLATQGAIAGDYGFDIAVDGGTAVSIVLPIVDYADEDAIATALQAEFDSNSIAADIVHNGTTFVVTSRSQGSNSSVAISAVLENTPGDFGLAAGSATPGTGPNADDYDFTVSVDGTVSGTISLMPGSYADEDALAAHIQSQINNDATLGANGADVDVIWNTDHFEITSRAFGDKSNVIVTAVGASAADLGLDSGASSSGTDVAGTFDGVVGFGVGDILLPKLDTAPHGISLRVDPGATTATLNYSRGFGAELSLLIDSYLETNGIIQDRESTLNSNIEDLDNDQEALDRRIDAFHERLLAQFLAMERIVSSLNSSGSALDDLANRLPFTARNN